MATTQPSGAQLTTREVEVLVGVARGLTNAKIGSRLYLTEATVKTHLRRLMAKLGARSRAHAVALVLAPHGVTLSPTAMVATPAPSPSGQVAALVRDAAVLS